MTRGGVARSRRPPLRELVALCLLASVGCSEADRFSSDVVASESVPVHELTAPEIRRVGTIDLTLGVESGDAPYEFSVISGVISDPDGRISVVRTTRLTWGFASMGELGVRGSHGTIWTGMDPGSGERRCRAPLRKEPRPFTGSQGRASGPGLRGG